MGSTKVELVQLLTLRNIDNKFDFIIEQAKKGMYHDFMSSHPSPKALLIATLCEFEELKDIMKLAVDGEFDE